eukprot:10370144-Ditylum_brightwellii.AAC.1
MQADQGINSSFSLVMGSHLQLNMVNTKLKEGGGDCWLDLPSFPIDAVKGKGFKQLPLAGRSVFDVCFVETSAFIDLSSGASHRTHHVFNSLSTS